MEGLAAVPSRAAVGGLRVASLACAALSLGCVHGGEEHSREPTTTWVGVVRYEAVNQRNETVGSGCSVDSSKYHEQIRFHAEPGDHVELTEIFRAITTTADEAEAHRDDVEYWCAQDDGIRYAQAPDASCWRSVAPEETTACFQQEGLVGNIGAVKSVPDAPLTAGKIDGFTLSIDVVGTGKQCVQLQCNAGGPGGEQLAFVVE
jgi:hypothetical protein